MLASQPASAEQKIEVDGFDVHYIVIPTVFLTREIADQYDLVRGKAWSLVNISVIDQFGEARRGKVRGGYRNLLSQNFNLDFREVVEDQAVYYLAPVKHTEEDTFRFDLTIDLPGERPLDIKFTQKMYRGLE
ncbi:MAG: DUF4426 domain-containing protein [Pseudomonadota bacterium]